MPKLLVSLPDGSSAVHELVEASISVGRLADNALQIEDASVSSQHAELTLTENGDYLLTDLGSTNGTMMDGRRVTEVVLGSGDTFSIGRVQLRFRSDADASAPSAATR